jgi:MFS family permease
MGRHTAACDKLYLVDVAQEVKDMGDDVIDSETAALPERWHCRTVLGLGAVSFFVDVHSESILALLPQFMQSALGLSMAAIGLIQGLAEATVAFVQLLSGWLSDRLGMRKPLAFAGYAVSTAVKAALALAVKPWHVLAVRVGDRLGKGLRTPPRDAMLADAVCATEWGKAYGLHRAMDSAGAIVGTLLALALFSLTSSYRLTFAWAALAGSAAVFVLLFVVQEPPRPRACAEKKIALRDLPLHFWWFVAAYAVFSAGNVTYAFFLLRCADVGVREALVPAVYLLHNVMYTAAGLPAGFLADALGARRISLLTMALHTAVCLGLAAARTPWLAVALTGIYGVVLAGDGSAVRALVAELLPTDLRASGMAAYRAIGGLATLPGSWVIGRVWDTRGASVAWVLAALLAATGGVMLFAGRECKG